jgi:ubiquinone/menaquinone biosynthesis C-methylase UbiE
MKSNDFDRIAFAYDRLTKLVFGNAIIDSQKFFLNGIPKGSSVLILGGGTGWILTELYKAKKNVSVCYIDASENMLAKAKERFSQSLQIQFILGTENDIPLNQKFDCVITNFYLDLFTEESIQAALEKIKRSIVPNAQWIATDFVENSWWHSLMLKSMYFFFRMISNIESQKLPEWNKAIQTIGGTQVDSRNFYSGFIQTSAYQF